MARTPADAALLLEAIAGVDPDDPATADVPLGDVRGELAARARRARRRALPRPPPRAARAPTSRAVFEAATAHARARREPGSSSVALPEAELILSGLPRRSRAPRRSTRTAAPGLYPARRDEYGADVLGRLDAATEVTLEQYLAGVRRPAARPRGVRARCSTGATSCSRRSAPGSPLPIGEETVVHDGRRADVPRARDGLHDAAGPDGPAGLRRARRASTSSASRSASSSRAAPWQEAPRAAGRAGALRRYARRPGAAAGICSERPLSAL